MKEGRLLVFARAAIEKLAQDSGNDFAAGGIAKQLLRRIPPGDIEVNGQGSRHRTVGKPME